MLNIANSFARFRKYKGLTKSELSRFLGTTPQAYEYETPGKSSNPTAARLFAIANHYKVSADYLLGLTDDPRPVNQILAEMEKSKSGGEYVTRAEFEELKASIAQLKQSTEN